MHHPLRSTLITALLCSLAATLCAQDTDSKLTGSLKVRGLVTSGDLQEDMGANKGIGLSASGDFSLTEKSQVFGEFTYTAFKSVNRPNPIQAPADPGKSGDVRKNRLGGFSLRGGYRQSIGETSWSWQAGVILDRLKFRQEVVGELVSGTPEVSESLTVTPESSKLMPGVFAGVFTRINSELTLEVNALTVGYEKAHWVPKTYSGVPATVETKGRLGLALECAVGFRF